MNTPPIGTSSSSAPRPTQATHSSAIVRARDRQAPLPGESARPTVRPLIGSSDGSVHPWVEPNNRLLFMTHINERIAAYIENDAMLSIDLAHIDRICLRYMMSSRGAVQLHNTTMAESFGMSVGLGASAFPIPPVMKFVMRLTGTIYLGSLIANSGAANQYQRVREQCHHALAKLLGNDFVQELHLLPFNAEGVERAIGMLDRLHPPIPTLSLRLKLNEMRAPGYQNTLSRRLDDVLYSLAEFAHIASSRFVPDTSADEEVLQQIDDLPKRLGQILTLAALQEGHLDVLLAASLMGIPSQTVAECRTDLTRAGYMRGDKVASQHLVRLIKQDIPEAKLQQALDDISRYYDSFL